MIYLATDHLNIFLLTCHQKPYEIQIHEELKMIFRSYMQKYFNQLNIFYELRQYTKKYPAHHKIHMMEIIA